MSTEMTARGAVPRFFTSLPTRQYFARVRIIVVQIAQIQGQMKLPDRIEQERYFRETAQIMVATEAAGEGINLQFST
jgi:hypothetical protein